MADPARPDSTGGAPDRLSQSIHGPTYGGSGVTGNVAGNAYIYQINNYPRSIQDAVHHINAHASDEAFEQFNNRPSKERITLLHLVRLDKAVTLVTTMRERVGLIATASLLQSLDELRMVELLGGDGLPRKLAAGIVAAWPQRRARLLIARLGVAEPASAAGLVERIAGAPPVPDLRTGPAGALDVLPPDRASRRFLSHLSGSPAAVRLLAHLPDQDEQRSLLATLSPADLHQRLTQASGSDARVLLTALPLDNAVRELDTLDPKLVAQVIGDRT